MARNNKHCRFQPNSSSINPNIPSGSTKPNIKKTNGRFSKLLANFGMYLMHFEAKKSFKAKIKATAQKCNHYSFEKNSNKRKPFRDEDIRRLIRLYAMHDNLYNPQNYFYENKELIEECFHHMSRYFPGYTASELHEQITMLRLLFENDFRAIELSKREGVPTLSPTTRFYDEFIFLQPYVLQQMEVQAKMDNEYNVLHKSYDTSRDTIRVETLPPKREQSGNADLDFKSSCDCVAEERIDFDGNAKDETKITETAVDANSSCSCTVYETEVVSEQNNKSDIDCLCDDQKNENTISCYGNACNNDKQLSEKKADFLHVYNSKNSNKNDKSNNDCTCSMDDTAAKTAHLTDILKLSCYKINKKAPSNNRNGKDNYKDSSDKQQTEKKTEEQTTDASVSCPCTVYETEVVANQNNNKSKDDCLCAATEQNPKERNANKNLVNSKKSVSISKKQQQQKTCDCCTSISRINCTSSMIHSLQPSCSCSGKDNTTTQYATTTCSYDQTFTEYNDNDNNQCKPMPNAQQTRNTLTPKTKTVALSCYTTTQESSKCETLLTTQTKNHRHITAACKTPKAEEDEEEVPQVGQVQMLCDMIKTELTYAPDFIYFDAKWRIIEILRDVHKRQLLYQKSTPRKCACENNPNTFKVLTPFPPQSNGKARNRSCPYCCKT